ncbi:MAG: HlyD family efflux transporter periplasmic adaptor subunit [Bacillota bacterium]|nr:HlyD family efflux transporter periplasmic adaptor subunit [Bacillota bacterium]
MKTKIPKKTRRIVLCYLAILVILYVIIYVVPKVTGMFETTQTLENGTLIISCEAEGYLVKDETINLADKTGILKYKVVEGTVIKKGTTITAYDSEAEESSEEVNIHSKYDSLLKNLGDYDGVKSGMKSPISGVLDFSMDGNENYFSMDNLKNITKEGVDERSYDIEELEREKVIQGEPIFKVSNDDNWYVVCWLKKSNAKGYEEGMEVDLQLPEGTVDATVYSVEKEGDLYKTVFYTNGYYKAFAHTRKADMTIVKSNNTGLIVDNECIIEVDGVKGVYVVDKDGDYKFKPINITASDKKQSVISEKTFTNDKYELVETVIVHDEVLRDPQKALELEKEDKE